MLEELKKAFRARQFWVSFGTFFVVMLGYSLASWLGSISAGEYIEYRESALHMALGGVYFGGFMLMFPFCVAFCYATGQVDEMRSGMMQWRAFRSSIGAYVKLKIGAGIRSQQRERLSCRWAGRFLKRPSVGALAHAERQTEKTKRQFRSLRRGRRLARS